MAVSCDSRPFFHVSFWGAVRDGLKAGIRLVSLRIASPAVYFIYVAYRAVDFVSVVYES